MRAWRRWRIQRLEKRYQSLSARIRELTAVVERYQYGIQRREAEELRRAAAFARSDTIKRIRRHKSVLRTKDNPR